MDDPAESSSTHPVEGIRSGSEEPVVQEPHDQARLQTLRKSARRMVAAVDGGERKKRKKEGSKLLEGARLENAKPVCNKPLPPVPDELELDAEGKEPTTLLLFYQYVEPPWTPKQHKHALNFVIELARKNGVTGRGRCAMEGLNCTCTGTAAGIRAFCQGLRDWNPLFNETDFKFTDGLEHKKKFKAFTLRKVDELVAYGLEGSYAPSLARNEAKHLNADEYHKMMAEKDTVIVDVRNVYESAIGHFQPPEGGAELIIPPVRHSFEFPNWFNAPETKEKLNGKKVMMYCTGGIRCERASALMDQIEKADETGLQTQGIYHCRGGIERYLKTFPEGGFWKGRNYLFDRRLEQVPEKKSAEEIEKDVESVCCVCEKPWGIYRGAKTCAIEDCKIPVIVCTACQDADPKKMVCPLCKQGDDFALRKLERPAIRNYENSTRKRQLNPAEEAARKRQKHADKPPSNRLFVGKLPLVIDASKIENALEGKIKVLRWIPDRTTGFWYGSVFAEMETLEQAKGAVKRAHAKKIKLGKRPLIVNFAPPNDGEEWPPPGHKHLERPPIPVS